MIAIILEGILYFVVEIMFQGILVGLVKGVKLIGIAMLKLITFSRKSMDDLKDKYKDSSKPYFLGFAVAGGLVYLITAFMS